MAATLALMPGPVNAAGSRPAPALTRGAAGNYINFRPGGVAKFGYRAGLSSRRSRVQTPSLPKSGCLVLAWVMGFRLAMGLARRIAAFNSYYLRFRIKGRTLIRVADFER